MGSGQRGMARDANERLVSGVESLVEFYPWAKAGEDGARGFASLHSGGQFEDAGVLRLRSALPHSAQDDKTGERPARVVVETPGRVRSFISGHGVLRLRSASPHSAQDDNLRSGLSTAGCPTQRAFPCVGYGGRPNLRVLKGGHHGPRVCPCQRQWSLVAPRIDEPLHKFYDGE